MKKRLYYEDSYQKEFSATVQDQCRIENSPAVILDATAFYPESGGQPCDTGFLGQARVMKVVENSAGEVVHILEHEIPSGQVRGVIDWERRFDHMQQHTGQHILSQAFIAAAKAPTLSFHMGQESSTIDIDMAQPAADRMEEAQKIANGIVFQNRAVRILTTDREKLNELGVRKESDREGEIRVIEVDGFDRSPCGGTHVRSTGEIGLIFISGFERYKGGTRVEFVAGGRALKLLQKDHELLKKLCRLYSAALDSIPDAAEKLLQERTSLSKENENLRGQLLDMEAAELLNSSAKTRYGSTVRRVYSGRSLESVKALAQKVTANPGGLAILGIADACQVIVARSRDLPGSCNDAVKQAISRFGGKGGGRPELAQAGGFSPDSLERWMEALDQYFLEISG
jgi:alanyl-tRNA synthetase